jgi:hypothetical protein
MYHRFAGISRLRQNNPWHSLRLHGNVLLVPCHELGPCTTATCNYAIVPATGELPWATQYQSQRVKQSQPLSKRVLGQMTQVARAERSAMDEWVARARVYRCFLLLCVACGDHRQSCLRLGS